MTENTHIIFDENDDLRLLCSSGLFDRDWYLAANPDVAEANLDLAIHFLQFGGIEGRAPGPDFSSWWYLDTYQDVKAAGVNPLIHYLKYGKVEGRIALSQKDVDDLRLIESSDLFDREWYLAKNPDVARLKLNPAFHYLYYGGFEGRDPGPSFFSKWYLDIYEDVKRVGINPLVHYLRYGRAMQLDQVQGNPALIGSSKSFVGNLNLSKNSDVAQPKVFGVGFSKTGTTSLEKAFTILGYKAWHGHWQNPHHSYALALSIHKDYEELFKIINYYDAFSDCPWGGSDLYLEIYKRLPGSKFILTIRDAESWYGSFEKMISKFDGDLETALDSFHANGRYGAVYFFKNIFNIETMDGNKKKIIDYYNSYNQNVINFFTKNRADFIVYDMADDGWEKLCNFLRKPVPHLPFPHENKSIDLSNLIVPGNSINVLEKAGNVATDIGDGIITSQQILSQQVKTETASNEMLDDLTLISTSRLFDETWYLANNLDVANEKINPVFHYLHYGGFEGRDPSRDFSSSWYLDVYEDVKRSGLNPLVHYLRYGQIEGRYAQSQRNTFRETGRQKVFCIGFNKTGTTSIELVLKNFGYMVGRQMEAELLMDDWAVRNFHKIIEYCQTADAFQDVPFSLDFTYQVLDQAFPNSKFILTVRNSAEEWYQSLVRFHAKIAGVTGVPTANDLKNASYRKKGWLWHQHQHIFGVDENTLYDQTLYMSCYTTHNRQILEYFKYRPNDLLVLNLAEPSSMQSLCEFLGIKYDGETMPHLNRSE